MPYSFFSAETVENTVSGLPYAMFVDSLRYGLYISGNCFAQYSYTSDGKSYFKNISGSFPLVVIENKGTNSAFANQGPYSASRNVVGFESMKLSFLGLADTVIIGKSVPLTLGSDRYENIRIYPNPTSGNLSIQGVEGIFSAKVFDCIGRVVLEKNFVNSTNINISQSSNGLYFLQLSDLFGRRVYTSKILLSK